MKTKYKAKKLFGQNFLVDQRAQQKIVEACALTPEDVVIEIGPGQGALTRLIAPKVKQLTCVEADGDLIPHLREEFDNTNVTIIHADFLSLSFPSVLIGNPNRIKIFGNIPYNISTPIIEKLIENRAQIGQAYLTVQLEFGQRLAAKPGGKDYGALTCFIQYHADVKNMFSIKNACFNPRPKVDSCFVKLDFQREPRYKPHDEKHMFRLIRQAFTQRRKTIVNALATSTTKELLIAVLESLKIDPRSRPETLSLYNYVDISNALMI